MGAHIQVSSIEDIFDLSNVRTKDIMNIDYITPMSGNEKVEYIHDNIELERTLPNYTASTNIKNNEQKILQHEYMIDLERNTPLTNMTINPGKIGEINKSSRNFNLLQKPQYGSFEGRGQMPNMNRVQEIPEAYENDKSKINKKVEEMFNRYRN